MASVCYFCLSLTAPVFLFLPLITFTVLQALADCDVQRWKTLHAEHKVTCEVKSRKSIVLIKSKVLLNSAQLFTCMHLHSSADSLQGKNHTMLLLSRRFIKTHWTNTQNTNKKMTIHFFIQFAIQHKYQNHNTAWSSLSVNARYTTTSPKWTVISNASHAVHSLQQRCLLSGSFGSFWSHVNKHVHTLLTYL